jgi:hypothetical protein
MFKTAGNSSSLLPSSGASSPTYRSNHPIARVLKSKSAKTILVAYVGFCALFTLKHIFSYHSQPNPIVYKHYDLQRTYDAGKSTAYLPYNSPIESASLFLFFMFSINPPTARLT